MSVVFVHIQLCSNYIDLKWGLENINWYNDVCEFFKNYELISWNSCFIVFQQSHCFTIKTPLKYLKLQWFQVPRNSLKINVLLCFLLNYKLLYLKKIIWIMFAFILHFLHCICLYDVHQNNSYEVRFKLKWVITQPQFRTS